MTKRGAARKSMEPWIKDEVEYYPHQVEAIRKLARRRSFLLADEMGLGKSLQAITVFAIDIARGKSKTCIVVCPATLKGNWADEFEKFTGIQHIVLNGTPAARKKLLEEFKGLDGPKVLIVNYEQVHPHLEEFNKIRFDVAIFDEAHYLKNPKSKRTKASLSLYSRRSFLLTGTPMLNKVNELWSILYRIDPDEPAFRKYWSFTHRYCLFGGFDNKEIVGVKNQRELNEKINTYMVRRLKKDVLDLPEVQIIERKVDLLKEQKKLYNEIVTDLQLTIPSEPDPVQIENALTKMLRLKQICGSTNFITGEDHSAKLDLALEDDMEILEGGNKVVVFTQFRHVQAAYKARLEKNGVYVPILNGDIPIPERQGVVKEWSLSKEPGVLLCLLQVAGVGLNMTAASHGSFLDKLYVPGLNQQAIDRLHRIGASETKSVQIREYKARGTIDTRIDQINKVKKDLIGATVDNNENGWKKKLLDSLIKEGKI